MKTRSEPEYVSLSWSSDEEYPEIKCPVCKKQNVIVNEEAGWNIETCVHLAFVRPYGGEYAYESVDYYKRHSRKRKTERDFNGFLEYLMFLGYDNRFFAYEVTFYGISCGPVQYTDIIGYDSKITEEDVQKTKIPKKKLMLDAQREEDRAVGSLLAKLSHQLNTTDNDNEDT